MTDIYAHIESDEAGWKIRILDNSDNEYSVCRTIADFSNGIVEYGAKHESQINVIWSKDENVTQEQFHEIEKGMRELQEQVKE